METPVADALVTSPSEELRALIDQVRRHAVNQLAQNPDVPPEQIVAYALFDVDDEESSIEIRVSGADTNDVRIRVHRPEDDEG